MNEYAIQIIIDLLRDISDKLDKLIERKDNGKEE